MSGPENSVQKLGNFSGLQVFQLQANLFMWIPHPVNSTLTAAQLHRHYLEAVFRVLEA